MRRRLVSISFAFALLSGLASFGWVAFRDGRSRELVAEARARLNAPLVEAPGLDRVQASTALSLLTRATELGHGDPTIEGLMAYAKALEDYQRGDLILAEGELTSASHRLGPSADLFVLEAAIARRRLDPARARARLDEALAREPEHPQGLLLAADLALDEDDGARALELLEPLLALAPRVGALHNRRGLARELLERFDGAEDDYRRAAELDARAHEAWINLGRLRRHRGDHRGALEAFDRAIRIARADADAHLGRGLSRAALGDVAGAHADFARAAELAPNDAEPLLALGDMERDLGKYTKAVETYRSAIAREDADAASWLKLGNALALLERYEEASRAFRAAIRRTPALAPAHNGLGASLMHLGRTEEAIGALDRAAELDLRDPNPLLNLALLHERTGDRAAAQDAWSRALERDPHNGVAAQRL